MSIYLCVDMVAVVSISIYIPDAIVYYIMNKYIYRHDDCLLYYKQIQILFMYKNKLHRN